MVEYRRQLRKNPILAQIKHGKLGVDTIFIAFGVMGFLFLPYYLSKNIRRNQ